MQQIQQMRKPTSPPRQRMEKAPGKQNKMQTLKKQTEKQKKIKSKNMETVYVTGHKSPDLDSVAGAVAYARLKQEMYPDVKYIPASAGKLNAETIHVLNKFGIDEPLILTTVAGKKLILVDHNEREQAIDDLDKATILEVIDHHKMNFSYSDPIRIVIEPLGASCTVIAKMFKADEIEIPKDLAGVMLGAILTDTVITKSPTTTDEDRHIIEELAKIAEVPDWQSYGMEIFKVRSSVSELTNAEIITADYKDFDINGKKVGIGQVETADPKEFDDRIEGLLSALEEKKNKEEYHSVILFISDILEEESRFLVASESPEKIAEAFDQTLENGIFTAPVLSRKKEVLPALLKNLN
jgi:manganese-dependent inorganic pyrophosphatase